MSTIDKDFVVSLQKQITDLKRYQVELIKDVEALKENSCKCTMPNADQKN